MKTIFDELSQILEEEQLTVTSGWIEISNFIEIGGRYYKDSIVYKRLYTDYSDEDYSLFMDILKRCSLGTSYDYRIECSIETGNKNLVLLYSFTFDTYYFEIMDK